MKRNGPLLTLLAGIVVAAVLFLLNVQATQIDNAGATAPTPAVGQLSAAVVPVPQGSTGTPPKVDEQPLTQRETPDGNWAGRAEPGVLALTIKDGKAIAYVCDGKKNEAWLKGTAKDGNLNLTGKRGAALSGTVDGKHAKGKVTLGGQVSKVDIDAVRKPSGLYRAIGNVRGAKLIGGWIVLKDGTQVGLATVGGRLTRPSNLDLTTGRATVGDTTVTAAQADPTR
jgi:hypothetical protein